MRILKFWIRNKEVIIELSVEPYLSCTFVILYFRNNIKEEAKEVDLLHHVQQPSSNVLTDQTSDSAKTSDFSRKFQTSNKSQCQDTKPSILSHPLQQQSSNDFKVQHQGNQATTPSHPLQDKTNIFKGLPVTSTVNKNVSSRLSDSGSNFGSPIPCGDSFFEDDAVLTQTHVEFMSRFKRHSLPNSNNNSVRNINSPTSNVTSPIVKDHVQESPRQIPNKFGVHNQNKSVHLNNSDSFISQNRFKSTTIDNDDNNDNFDSIDDNMNLELAEQSDFDFGYKISSVTHPANTKKSSDKGSNFGGNSSVNEVAQGNGYDSFNDSGEDMFDIDEFEEEDFGAVLESEDHLPTIAHKSRASTGSAGSFRFSHLLISQTLISLIFRKIQ